MASYGIPPQLYPYLYAPKAALGLHSSPSSLDSSDLVQNLRHRKSGNHKDYESDEKNNEEIMSKEGDDENLDENENVEID
jgi:hypothetical protein